MAAAFVLLWCSGYPAGKIAVQHAGPFTILWMRFVIAGAIFAVLAVFARARRPSRTELGRSAIVGLLSLALSFGGIYKGLRLGVSSGMSALFVGAMPLATALFGRAFGERPTPRQWVGLALGFAGVVLVLDNRLGDHRASALGYVASAIGLLGLSLGTLCQKRYSTHVDLRVGLAIQHFAASLAMLPMAAFAEHFRNDASVAFGSALAWIIAVNALGGFALLFALVRRGGANEVAALFFLVPPITAVMGWLVLGEKLSAPMVPGFALVAFGVWLGTRREVAAAEERAPSTPAAAARRAG